VNIGSSLVLNIGSSLVFSVPFPLPILAVWVMIGQVLPVHSGWYTFVRVHWLSFLADLATDWVFLQAVLVIMKQDALLET
jgi:hypothetical protein